MEEVKVWVEGIERSVSGLTSSTTCADIIYALAHFTGQKGRFVLVERFRERERSLAPGDRPLEILAKWGEHGKHVVFMLKQVAQPNDNSSSPSSAETTSIYARPNTLLASSLSTTSLPSPIGRLRPPPPAYHQVIEQRYNSLSRRGNFRGPSVSESALYSSSTLTLAELERLVEAQRATIETQTARLAECETNVDADLRELAQLERQQANLRLVLQPLRSAAWGTRLAVETANRDGLLQAINALRARLDATTRAVAEHVATECELSTRLEHELRQLADP